MALSSYSWLTFSTLFHFSSFGVMLNLLKVCIPLTLVYTELAEHAANGNNCWWMGPVWRRQNIWCTSWWNNYRAAFCDWRFLLLTYTFLPVKSVVLVRFASLNLLIKISIIVLFSWYVVQVSFLCVLWQDPGVCSGKVIQSYSCVFLIIKDKNIFNVKIQKTFISFKKQR